MRCFRIKRILRSLHKTTAPRWYECAKYLHHTNAYIHSAFFPHRFPFALDLVQALFYELVSSLFFIFTNILLVHTKYLVGVSMLLYSLYFDVLLFSISFLVSLMYVWNCVNEWDASHSTNRILLIPTGLENDIAEPNRTEPNQFAFFVMHFYYFINQPTCVKAILPLIYIFNLI